jgi:hypothetical protein
MNMVNARPTTAFEIEVGKTSCELSTPALHVTALFLAEYVGVAYPVTTMFVITLHPFGVPSTPVKTNCAGLVAGDTVAVPVCHADVLGLKRANTTPLHASVKS